MFILTCTLSVERKFWTTMEAFDRQRDTLVWARQMRLACLTSTNACLRDGDMTLSSSAMFREYRVSHLFVVDSLLRDEKLLDVDGIGIREQAYLYSVYT